MLCWLYPELCPRIIGYDLQLVEKVVSDEIVAFDTFRKQTDDTFAVSLKYHELRALGLIKMRSNGLAELADKILA